MKVIIYFVLWLGKYLKAPTYHTSMHFVNLIFILLIILLHISKFQIYQTQKKIIITEPSRQYNRHSHICGNKIVEAPTPLFQFGFLPLLAPCCWFFFFFNSLTRWIMFSCILRLAEIIFKVIKFLGYAISLIALYFYGFWIGYIAKCSTIFIFVDIW